MRLKTALIIGQNNDFTTIGDCILSICEKQEEEIKELLNDYAYFQKNYYINLNSKIEGVLEIMERVESFTKRQCN